MFHQEFQFESARFKQVNIFRACDGSRADNVPARMKVILVGQVRAQFRDLKAANVLEKVILMWTGNTKMLQSCVRVHTRYMPQVAFKAVVSTLMRIARGLRLQQRHAVEHLRMCQRFPPRPCTHWARLPSMCSVRYNTVTHLREAELPHEKHKFYVYLDRLSVAHTTSRSCTICTSAGLSQWGQALR